MAPSSAAVGGARCFIDISVLRNIARNVSNVPGCIVYNVDDLKEVVTVTSRHVHGSQLRPRHGCVRRNVYSDVDLCMPCTPLITTIYTVSKA